MNVPILAVERIKATLGMEDISPESLIKITVLDLSRTSQVTCNWLDSLPNLEWLNLADNPIDSLDGIQGLPNLKTLGIDQTIVRDLAGARNHPSLDSISAACCPLSTVDLGDSSRVESLYLNDSKLVDLSRSPRLPELRTFIARYCPLESIGPFV